MAYRVNLTVTSNHVEAWVFDLPGCLSSRELLPVAIAEHRAWLAGHDEAVPDRGSVEVVEEVQLANVQAPDGEFCFAADSEAVSRDEFEAAIRRVGYARSDLLVLVEPLPDQVLDWEPPKSAMSFVHDWAPEVRSIRGIIQHIASTDGYYRHGLEDGDVPASRTAQFDLREEREKLIDRIRSLSEEERSRVFRPRRPWRSGPEDWTLRKVFRRTISHERFHTKEIEQRLAWLVLGVPDFQRSPVAS